MQIHSPKSHITNRQARPPVPVVPRVPGVRDVRDVRDVFDVSLVRDVRDVFANARCMGKNRTPRNVELGMRNADAEARASARAYHPKRHSQAGIWSSNSRLKPGLRTPEIWNLESGIMNRRLKPGLKTPRRFTRFKCFRYFISFMCFNRFRNVWPRRKMKQRSCDMGNLDRYGRGTLQLRNYPIFRTIGGFRV